MYDTFNEHDKSDRQEQGMMAVNYLPANALLVHMMQQNIHHHQLAPQGSNVQRGFPC